ncbi:DEAD/DEAH box helicase [Paenibacillus sp. NEAU-GSW1]|uniref:DEAD/DEAH box helicase n=1 Tax=Paenibacillus sp. NEAU-GSW1 TaxID=2682486 RepID=UPI0012E22717|nr:DEAD/DEAH box helicase [Paenibacillus sp. NEAU-GSW1]MUT68724.1 helicase SNF [Paenibacillus sp. NEAU-GSW1]
MGFNLSLRVIKLLCGAESFRIGEIYNKQNGVTITENDESSNRYKAVVTGDGSRYSVTIELDRNGDLEAACGCPAYFTQSVQCKHIAAALIRLYEVTEKSYQPARVVPSLLHPNDTLPVSASAVNPRYNDRTEAAEDLIRLFERKPVWSSGASRMFESRTALAAEFTVRAIQNGAIGYLFCIEMRIGPKRLYTVSKIADFLNRIERKQSFSISKSFMYDPELHCFQPEHDAVVRQFIQLSNEERLLRENGWSALSSNSKSTKNAGASVERMLLIPPRMWDTLVPLLQIAPNVRLDYRYSETEGIRYSNSALPIQFAFDRSEQQGGSDSYQLHASGLEELTVMEHYGLVINGQGELVKLPPEQLARLSQLQRMMESSFKNRVQIASDFIEPFMEKVVPGLLQLGALQMAETIEERILQAPLKAKLYLDRVRDKLLAQLEFQYGDISINPTEAASGRKQSKDRILIRDGELERRIIELMEESGFARTESGYVTADEETEYHFLYHIVPLLEPLLKIYATTAVKIRLHTGEVPPRIAVRADDRVKWMQFHFSMDGIPDSDIRLVLESLEEKRRYYRLPNGSLMPLENEKFLAIIRFMNEVGIRSGDLDGSGVRLPIARGITLLDSEDSTGTIKWDKPLRELLDHLRNPDTLNFPIPGQLDPVLREYQKFGYQWMRTLAHYGFGGILADEMGLGKTVQAIAFIQSMQADIREQQKPALIVSPASLLYNWQNELARFAPALRVAIADGAKANRSELLKAASRGEYDVLIASYPLLRMDSELYAKQQFHTLIVDEAQYFKNYTTQTAQAVKLLQADFRFALTGTPVENRLEELRSIFEAVFPGLLPNRKSFGELTQEMLAKRIRPFLLRRRKSDVLKELPDKIETLQLSELLPDQKKLYAAYLAKLKQETLKHLANKSFEKNKIRILAGLTRLRQLCLHPALFVEGYTGDSAKLEQLLELIEDCRSAGRRALIFSQFTGMLDLIGRELAAIGAPFFYLDGQTPAKERLNLCNRFNDGERDLFLISLKAGGTGLNLTGADTVILYDLWWNPAVEQQAADRAHRMGQKNVVQVIRLAAQGTIEQKMVELQQKKLHLLEDMIQPGDEALSALTEQDIRELLQL